MHAPARPLSEYVSVHALVRWVERVEGIDTAPARRQLKIRDGDHEDSRLLDYLALSDVIDVDAIRRKISGDDLREAIRLGRSSFKRGEVTFLLRRGAVTTVFGPGQDVDRHRPPSVKKLRLDQDRADRRNKGKRAKWGKR